MKNNHEINRSAARPQDFDAAETVRSYNERKRGIREIAKEKVASRPQIDLERREIPPDVHCHVDEFCDAFLDGYDARQQDVSAFMQGMKL